jgi:hypothetical protein
VAAVAFAIALGAAPPTFADTVLSVEPAAPKLSAYDGTAAWSTYDASARAWFLVTRRDGMLERAHVAPRSVPFDVDLGTTGSGRVVAAYSRCHRDPVGGAAPTGRGCDLFAYDLYTRRERRLQGPSTAASEYMPSLANGRLAFGRVRGGRTEIYVGRLAGAAARRVPGGTANHDARTGLTGLDLTQGQLAITWRTFGPAGEALPYGAAELRVDDLRRGTQSLVVRLANSNLETGSVFTPAIVGRWVRYGLTWVAEGDTEITARQTFDVRQGFRTSLPLPDRLAGVAEPGNGESYIVRCDPDAGPCSLVLIEANLPPFGPDADILLATAERPTPLSWDRRWSAYSAYDASVPGYRLVLRSREGRVVRPNVPPRATPFDADLGREAHGELTAVYSRCRVEPRTDPIDGLPIPASGRGCDVYRYDVRGGREHRLRAAAHPGRSEFLPAFDGSRLAYARRTANGSTALYVADVATGRSHKVTGDLGRLGPRSLDLHGRRLAVAWDDRLGSGQLRSRVRLIVLGGRSRTLASVTSHNGTRRNRSLGFDGSVLSWVGHHLPGLRPRVAVRYNLASGKRRIFVLPDGATAFVPWTIERGVPLPHAGAYGRIVPGGWSLRAAIVLPELVR